MAKDKDRALNPAAAALKASKKSALKKSKAAVATQRSERLAKRNPERLQRQIDELKATEAAQGGQLKPRDKQQLEQLERDVRLIKKARENAGTSGSYERRDGGREQNSASNVNGRGGQNDRGRGRGRGRDGNSTLGKRRRSPSRTPSPLTDEDVRRIPMPRDTPPPIPPRPRRHNQYQQAHGGGGRNPNDTPLGPNARQMNRSIPLKPAAVAQTTYSSAPQIRDLTKEATARFVPAAVAAKLKARDAFEGRGGGGSKGADADADGEQHRLLEPEELDRLEKEGYLDARRAADEAANEEAYATVAARGGIDEVNGKHSTISLEEEEAAFARELEEAEIEARRDDPGEIVESFEAEDDTHAGQESGNISTARKGEVGTSRFALVEDIDDDTWD